MLEATLATSRRVLGRGHRDTLDTARYLETLRSAMGKQAKKECMRPCTQGRRARGSIIH